MKLELLRDAAVALSDLALPRECVVCGKRLGMKEKHLCIYCMAHLPLTYNWSYAHNPMADRYNDMIQRDISSFEPYSYAASLFFYKHGDNFRKITQSLKYKGDEDTGKLFSGLLGKELRDSNLFSDVDCVVPVPLHWSRHWERGYNQAAVIGKAIASQLGAIMLPSALKRVRRTKSQTTLDIEGKKRNVAGAFCVNEKLTESLRHFRHILIVDDVFTTGATINSCHKVIRALVSPATRISAATLGVVG
ncbi:MAG: hypothetical protein WCR48_08510 [Bacteroidales bacterium]